MLRWASAATAIAALAGALRVSTQSAPPPILLVVNNASANPYGPYLGEMLKAEGLNSFSVAQLSTVTSTTLAGAQVVILAETTLTSAQAVLFSNYAAAGGRLIVMRPDAQLLPALGLTAQPSSTSEGYFAINQQNSFANGFPTTTLPFHGQAQHYTMANGAQVLATVYSNAATPTAFPAIVRYQSTVTWAYDLATSVILTRQGFPANAAERDGQPPYRTEDIFYNAIDRDKVPIPYADVQMRMLARAIGDLLSDAMPLPRLWYFPGTNKTLVILTGDAHANPQAYYDAEISALESYGGRISFYVSSGSPSAASVAAWRSRGHEVGMHPAGFQTGNTLTTAFQNSLNAFTFTYGSNPSPTVRIHQLEWQGWVDAAKIEANFGIGLDTSYYTWGPAVTYPDARQAHGYINGSGQPMRFVDQTGTIVSVYQQVTSLIDEALLTTAASEHLTPAAAVAVSQQIIDNSQAGDYAAVVTQFHVDYFGFGDVNAWATGTMNYARSLGIPMWTAERWLKYTNARYATTLTNLSWSSASRQLSFSVAVPTGSETQSLALPHHFGGFGLTSVLVDGTAAAGFQQQISARATTFVNVPAGSHNIVVSYNTPLPTASLGVSPATITQGQSATLSWSTANATSVSIDQGIGVVGASGTRTVSPLVNTTYTITATNTAGSATAATTLTVIPPPPTVTASVSPSAIAAGDPATLTWSTTNAGTVTIDQGIGIVPSNGTRIVSPASTTTYNVTVTNVTGSASAATTLTVNPAPVGSSLRFNGTNQRARFTTLPAQTVFTVEGWVKRTADTGRWETFFSNVNGGYSAGSVNVYVDGANTDCGSTPPDQYAWGYTRVAGGWFIQCSGVTANLNAWHHIAVTRDSANVARIFIDGVLRATANGTGTPTTTGLGAFNVGDAGDAATEFFPGLLDEVRISSVARYSGNFTPQTARFATDASTVALYHLDEGAGQNLADASGNGRHGFLGTSSAAEASDPVWSADVPFTGPPAPTISFSVAPTTITLGASATLTWTTSNATAAAIDQGIGTVPISGSRVVSPTSTTTYTLTATNANGSTTATATLTVNVPPAITLQPSNQAVSGGQNASFTVAATGTPAPTYQWQVATGGGPFTNVTNTPPYSGATTTTLTITGATVALNGAQYRAIATNSAGTATSNAALLTVSGAPVITTQPANQTVNEGQNASFTVAASGAPAPTLQWQVSSGGGAFTNLTNVAPYSGVTAATLTITGATAGLSGNLYRAVATNGVPLDATSTAATLTVNVAPAITAQPTNQTIVAGQNGSFTATATGTPAPTLQWQVSTDGGATFVNLTNTPPYSGVTTSVLTLTGATASLNNNQYRLVATNSAGTATSTAATLTVNTPPGAPTITTQPTSQAVNAGQNAVFTVAANGTPAPGYQWQVSTGGGPFTNLTNTPPYSGVTTTTLAVTGVTAAMSGNQYRAIASNGVTPDATSAAATLTVNTAPVFTTQPANLTVNAGLNASFTVAAIGTPTPTYQWQVSAGGGPFTNLSNTAPYSGVTTATLTLTGATVGLSGNQYRAVATNSVGTINSTAATLTVNATVTGGSLLFNGTNQLARFTTMPAMTVFTVEGWVKRTSDTGRYETFLSNAANGYGQETFGVYVDGGNADCGSSPSDQFAWGYTRVGGGWFFQCSGVTAALNVWFHIAVTRDSANVTRIFINGELRSTTTATPAPTTSTGAFAIGAAGDAVTEFFPGLLDEVRISSVARYSVSFTPQTTPFATDANTVALYHLDEGTGQTLTDASGNSRNGVLGTSSAVEAVDPQRSTDTPVQ